jgi:hypothetical protein
VQVSSGVGPVNTNLITINPSNSSWLLSGGDDFNCPSQQGLYASSDAGSTWVRNCLATLHHQTGAGNPILGYDLHNNAFAGGTDFTGTKNSVVVIAKSTNNGMTWGPVKQVVAALLGGVVDNPWMVIDTNASSPHANSLYIAATQRDTSSNSLISVTHSTDGGARWSTVLFPKQFFPVVDDFSSLTAGKDGTLYLSWLRCTASGPTGDCGSTQATMMFSKSSDGGNTWSTPVISATATLAPDSCSCAFYGNLPKTSEPVSDIPVIAVDNSSGSHAGTLYVVAYNWTGQFMQVTVVHSTDGGASWSAAVMVAPSTVRNDEFQPWANVSSGGRLAVTWLDRRHDLQNLKYQPFIAFSGDSGTSFSMNQALSSFLSDPSSVGNFRMHAWSGRTVYAVWPDTRTGVSQDEIGGFQF